MTPYLVSNQHEHNIVSWFYFLKLVIKNPPEKIKSFLNNEKNFEKFKLSLLKKTKDYTVYQHCKKLSEILTK
jgi:hypothetical protein